jgi:hypothetical protein
LIETDQQRRWWFATHPEYSHRSTGRRGAKSDDSDKIDPEKVDDWADERLKNERDPVAIELLNQAKFWFGTEFASKPAAQQYAMLWGDDEPVGSDALFAGKSGNDSSPQQILNLSVVSADSDDSRSLDDESIKKSLEMIEKARIEDEKGIIADPHTALDLAPITRGLRLFTAPRELLKSLLRRKAEDAVLNVKERRSGGKGPRLPPKGSPERKAIEAARTRGVRAKRKEELENIRGGGKGSGVWTEKELEGIRQNSEFPDDARWHHDPTVANRPDLAADPRVVHPLRGGNKGHLRDGHQGNYQNPRE